MPELVTIAPYRDVPTAGLVQSKLEGAGIPCFLDDEFTIGVNWLYSNALGGVKLKVPREYAEEALALLASDAESPAPEEASELPPASACPACGATEIETVNCTRKSELLTIFLSWVLLSVPFFFNSKRYRCIKCGHRWE